MKRVLLDNGNYLGEVSTLFKSDCQNRKRGKKTVRIHVVCSKRQCASTGSNKYCLIEIH